MAVDLFQKLSKYNRENKLAHVYLIETNNQEKCLDDIINFSKELCCLDSYQDNCSKCNLCHLLEKRESPNVTIIRPDGKNIKKEQVLELKRKMSYKPFLAKANIYIVMESEKLNESSANTMLKFIEDPEDNCYGFFVTNNKENVLLTIQSRCELEKILYDKLNILATLFETEEEKNKCMDTLNKYLYAIEVEKNLTIMYNRSILFKNYSEKSDIEKILKVAFDIYSNKFYNAIGVYNDREYDNFSFLDNNIVKLEKKRKLLAELLNGINYNLNLELMMDRFVIEMSEINE